jgi:hypothetical protein
MRAVLLSIILALAGCAGEIAAPPPVVEEITPGEWEQGALAAAESLGCKRTVWQIDGETFKDAAAVYSHDYTPGDCLILTPHHGGPNYYLGYAGQFDGCECGPLIAEWPGTPVIYLSDDLHSVRL